MLGLDKSEDVRVNRAAEYLYVRFEKFKTKKLTPSVARDVDRLLKDHRNACKRIGIHFPELIAICLPEHNYIEIVRRDLERPGIERVALNLTVKIPSITMQELAEIMARAFPQLRPRTFDAPVRRVVV